MTLLGFKRCRSMYIIIAQVAVRNHLGSNSGIEASRMEVIHDRINPSGFGTYSWSFPAMDFWVEVIHPSYRGEGRLAEEMSEPA